MDVEPRRLRAFLAVAETLHFSRAAALLHVSQPALSQQVRLLEEDLGARLFDRTSRQVALTAAGEALLQAAPRVLYETERLVEDVRQAATGVTGRLTIGSVRTGLASVVPGIVREFTTHHPRIRFELVHMDTTQQLRALQERTIDLGVVRSASPVRTLRIEPLVSEPLMLAVPSDHALAGREEVDPTDLAGEQFVSWPRHLGADFSDIVTGFCRAHGFDPDVVSEANDIDSQLALVAAGFGVSLQPAFYAAARPAGVAFCRLGGPPPQVALQLAWRRDNPPGVVQDFVDVARRVTRGPNAGSPEGDALTHPSSSH